MNPAWTTKKSFQQYSVFLIFHYVFNLQCNILHCQKKIVLLRSQTASQKPRSGVKRGGMFEHT